MIVVHVAVGVVFNDAGQVLIALRGNSQHLGGLWEFPGGKLEIEETVEDALDREFSEEVGLTVLKSSAMMKIRHDYGDNHVLLDVRRVEKFEGIAAGKEGQEIKWVEVSELNNFSFPKANREIVQALENEKETLKEQEAEKEFTN